MEQGAAKHVDPAATSPLIVAEERRIALAKRRVTVRELLRHWDVVRVIALRDLTVKYKQSVLGPAWLVILPAGLLAGLIVGFQSVLHVNTEGAPYPLFALAGLTCWTYFQAALSAGSTAITGNAVLVLRTAAPRLAFPIAILISTLPTLALTLLAALAWSIASGQASERLVLLPLALIWLLVLTSGVVAMASSLAVFARDIVNAVPFVLQIGIFFAPVGYSISNIAGVLGTLLALNPITGPIELLRWSLIATTAMDVRAVVISAVTGIILVVVGWEIFVRSEPAMADAV